jgi:hypothetical protein
MKKGNFRKILLKQRLRAKRLALHEVMFDFEVKLLKATERFKQMTVGFDLIMLDEELMVALNAGSGFCIEML